MLSCEVKKPEKPEQHEIWMSLLDKVNLHIPEKEVIVSTIVIQFDLDVSCIQNSITETMLSTNNRIGKKSEKQYNNKSNYADYVSSMLWHASRKAARPNKLGSIAQQITPKAKMDDLVLPEKQKKLLEDIVIFVLQR